MTKIPLIKKLKKLKLKKKKKKYQKNQGWPNLKIKRKIKKD
jgi:hypothetical protein